LHGPKQPCARKASTGLGDPILDSVDDQHLAPFDGGAQLGDRRFAPDSVGLVAI